MVLPFISTSSLEHTHIDGVRYTIIFYQLADGRGWIHDFNPKNPDMPALTRGWFNDHNSSGHHTFTTAVPCAL